VTPHEARQRFAAARVARLATADAAGRPHIVPVTFAVEGDVVYSAVDVKPKRGTALKRLANVAATGPSRYSSTITPRPPPLVLLVGSRVIRPSRNRHACTEPLGLRCDATLAMQDAAYSAIQGQVTPEAALSELQSKLETLTE